MQTKKEKPSFSIVALFCFPYLFMAILFFVATLNLPIGFYEFFRFLIFTALNLCCLFLVMIFMKQWYPIITLNAIISILFNPVFPFYFDKSTWIVIDIICAILMIANAIYVYVAFLYSD